MPKHFSWFMFFSLAVVAPFSVAFAQQQSQRASADDDGLHIAAVSIRPLPENQDNTGYGGGFDGAYFRAHAYSVEMLLRSALGIDDPTRIENLPKWASAEKYEITASLEIQDGSSSHVRGSSDQARQIELSILKTRFNLVFHNALARRPVLSLVQVKMGSRKMNPVPARLPERPTEPCIWTGRAPGYLKADSCSMDDLASALNVVDDRQIVNNTNLDGHFAFQLHFNDSATSSVVNGTRFSADPDRASDWPSIYSALPAQLGLKLKAATADVPIVIIDKITGPTEN